MATTTYTDEVLADSPWLYWKLDETSGTTATDSSGNGRSGTYTNSPTLNQTALINEGKSVDFDGTNDHVKYTLASNFTGSFTMECWINSDTYASFPGVFGAWAANSSGNYGSNLQLSNTGSFDVNLARSNFTFWDVNVGGFGSVSTGTRYHVALVVDDVNDTAKVFINGTQAGSTITGLGPIGLGASGKELRVGSLGSIGGFWNGKIQGFAVYTTALSSTRILAHYNAGKDKEINPIVTDTDIAGKDASIITNQFIDASVSNIAINGSLSNLDINEVNTADVTNISVAANAATLILDQNLSTDSTNVNIDFKIPTLAIDGNVTIPGDTAFITVDDTDPSLIIGITQTAVSTNISINEQEVNVLYPSLVLSQNPTHYYKFDLDASPTVITDLGSNPIDLIWTLGESSDYTDGIPGDPLSESASFNINADNPGGSDILTFSSNIFSDENNYTVEFWVKTLDPYVAIICADKNNQTISGKTYRNNAVIGIRDGYLAFWIHRETGAADVIKSTNKLNNNIWNHVVLTKKTIGSSIQYNSYVNAEETDVLISLGDFMPWIVNAPRPSLINYLNDGGTKQTGHTYNVYLDEFAIYNKALEQNIISDHYTSGHGIDINIQVEADVTNINIDGKDSSIGTVINTDVTNINVKDKGVLLAVAFSSGGPTNRIIQVGTTVANVSLDGKDSTESFGSFIDVDCQSTNIKVNQTNTNTVTRLVEFKFVKSSDTSLSAEDAEAITELDFGGLLYNQIKKLSFAIANTKTTSCNFNIVITSNEQIVPNAVQVSLDNISYYNSVTIESVRPNSITNPIYVKFDVNMLDVLGPGTFLLNVEQI